MMHFYKTKFKYTVLITFLLLFNFCQTNTVIKKLETTPSPPESNIVLENGSRPPEYFKVLSEAKIDPDCLTCNSQNRYSTGLKPFSKVSAEILLKKLKPFLNDKFTNTHNEDLNEKLEDHVMWAMVRGVLIEGNNNNLGAIILKGHFWTDKNGRKQPLTIFPDCIYHHFQMPKNSWFSIFTLKRGKG